jgi:hypothetical protein
MRKKMGGREFYMKAIVANDEKANAEKEQQPGNSDAGGWLLAEPF